MLQLVKPSEQYEKSFVEMMDEWRATGEDITPYSISRLPTNPFLAHLDGYAEEEKGILYGGVPATTFWAYNDACEKIVGAINIRHWLNDRLLKYSGHIGAGIRPSERRKGYASKMIALALFECKVMGLDRVLMVCDKDNVGSAKSIIKNGGVLENETVHEDGTLIQRYWIEVI